MLTEQPVDDIFNELLLPEINKEAYKVTAEELRMMQVVPIHTKYTSNLQEQLQAPSATQLGLSDTWGIGSLHQPT